MKKIFKVTNWGDVAFTSANVLDKSHWLVKALHTALMALDIGNFSITYSNATSVILTTDDYGQITLLRPTQQAVDGNQPYVIYIDTEKKELLGCSQDGSVKGVVSSFNQSTPFNCARGIASCPDTTGNYGYATSKGGLLRLKFKDGVVVGGSINNRELSFSGSNRRFISQVASPFYENVGVLPSPIGQSVSIDYHRLANASYDNNGLSGWDGSFFESIFLCDKYYIGAMASADNKKFIFNGLLFLVDDATDIGIIETTV